MNGKHHQFIDPETLPLPTEEELLSYRERAIKTIEEIQAKAVISELHQKLLNQQRLTLLFTNEYSDVMPFPRVSDSPHPPSGNEEN